MAVLILLMSATEKQAKSTDAPPRTIIGATGALVQIKAANAIRVLGKPKTYFLPDSQSSVNILPPAAGLYNLSTFSQIIQICMVRSSGFSLRRAESILLVPRSLKAGL